MDNLETNTTSRKRIDLEESFNDVLNSEEDVVPYSQSLTRLREIQFNLDLRYDEGVEFVARNMLGMNMDDDTIAYVTKLSPERIQELRTSNE